MKTAMKSLLLIIFVGIMLIASLSIVQARYRRGGDDTFYDFRTCTNGISGFLAIYESYNYDNNKPTLVGYLVSGPEVLPSVVITSLVLTPTTEEIPGLPDTPGAKYYMDDSLISYWTILLEPGTRVKLQLDVPNSEDIPFIYTTVENCSVTDPAPPDSYVVGQDASTTIPDTGEPVTSTIQVDPGHEPIGDVNVAIWIEGQVGDSIKGNHKLQASLTSPDGTKVVLFDYEFLYTNYRLGSRCKEVQGSLIGDEKADLVLDDDSVFHFGDELVTPHFINTAVKPEEPLGSFFNQDPGNGSWELELINQSINGSQKQDLELKCWYLEIEDAPAPTCYALTRNHSGTGGDPTASPANSTGCSTGQYIAGQSINVTADPAAGHHVDSWNGTDNNSSTASSNTVSMPAGPHTVTANYVQNSGNFTYLPVILLGF